jgi:hypothetical protein
MPNFPDSREIEWWQIDKGIDNRMARDLLAQAHHASVPVDAPLQLIRPYKSYT